MSVVIYEVAHLDYGAEDERTGFWLQRCTIADDRGNGIAHGSVIDRKPVAKFDDWFEAQVVKDLIKTHRLRLMPEGWTMETVAKEILR